VATNGYARVSTNSRDLLLQEQALRAAGCTAIWAEKISGARSDNRPKLKRLIGSLSPGDTVIVTRLDRLARSSRDLLNIVHQLNEVGALFKSLAEAWCDTTTPHGRLILTVLGGLAEFERSLIMARTQAGIAHARAIGKTFGRPASLTARQKLLIAERYANDETMSAIAKDFSVSEATISRVLRNKKMAP